MVADLLELHQRRQHETLTLDALRRLDGGLGVLDHGFVKRCLLFGQVAEHLHLELFGQIRDDALVRLQPTENERAGDAPQPLRHIPVGVDVDRQEEALPKCTVRTNKARVEKLHQAPQVAHVVLDRRARHRDAVTACQ